MTERPPSIVPEVLKPLRREFHIPDGMLNVAMPQIGPNIEKLSYGVRNAFVWAIAIASQATV
jgi:hypothetical protein